MTKILAEKDSSQFPGTVEQPIIRQKGGTVLLSHQHIDTADCLRDAPWRKEWLPSAAS